MSEQKHDEDRVTHGDSWDYHGMWHWHSYRPIFFALILIWAGLVWLADSLHWFPYRWWHSWGFFLLGAGIILLFGTLYRNIGGGRRRFFGFGFFPGIVLIIIGLGIVVGWGYIWPLFLIAIGLLIILRAVARRA